MATLRSRGAIPYPPPKKKASVSNGTGGFYYVSYSLAMQGVRPVS